MPIIAADLGGTKLNIGLFTDDLKLISMEKVLIAGRKGAEVGGLISAELNEIIRTNQLTSKQIRAIGISVPGIYHEEEGTVWAPNIPGWEKYPLPAEIRQTFPEVLVTIHSDRSCYITAEVEQGAAKGCRDAVYIAVGTGIGAGIISGGRLISGSHDIAGAVGWMALDKPHLPEYSTYGCFESTASGDGIARLTLKKISKKPGYSGFLKDLRKEELTAEDVFIAWEKGDTLAIEVINHCIETWGMALANIVSLLNPEMIIFGGGVFGPAVKWIPDIINEARRWAQPISMKLVKVVPATFGNEAGLIGAACLASGKLAN